MNTHGHDETPAIVIPTPPRSRLPRVLAAAAAALALAVLAGAGTIAWFDQRCGGVGNGVRLIGGECIGVTDGSHVFHEEFEEIQALIAAENERVAAQSTPSVTVAMLATFTFGEVSPMDPGRTLRALEGAYTAMMRANDDQDRHLGDTRPLIQLHLANMGSRQKQWEPAVDKLLGMTQDPAPLVAVIGMGVSVPETREAAELLSARGIPMVSSIATADGLDHGHINGLLRTSPSNSAYVRALHRFLQEEGLPERAALVYDTTEEDLFTATLREAYQRELGEYVNASSGEFRGTPLGQQPVPGLFDTITRNICAGKVDTVLYAGRAADLDSFLYALADRSCQEDEVRVLFASIGLSVLNDEEMLARIEGRGITVLYASATDPGWSAEDADRDRPAYHPHFQAAYEEYVGGGAERLNSGYAVIHHDAFAIAATAIRLTNHLEQEGPPKAGDVHAQLMLLHGEHQVRGGSGTLSHSPELGGEAGGKYVPVVQVPLPGEDAPGPEPYVIPADGIEAEDEEGDQEE